ncbi:hypothetical protein CSC65_05700 [Pseudoxanthomonas daejeonensis]|uniref:Uncharacterized protein n=1 Tax=Pseudoxanthomonas daejeonensis TaxID=266062 RepID=A0ABQ6Z921_9GAMM|nr:hypothetical protein CSC65_05700 [Pseudoxanthomonas daejeonensis]
MHGSSFSWEGDVKTAIPDALEAHMRNRASEDIIADTNRFGHSYLSRSVVLATCNDPEFGQHIPPTNNLAPYYLFSDDKKPQAIWSAQDEALRAAVDMESERTQRFAMLHYCESLSEARILVKCGADLDQLDQVGETALLSFLQLSCSTDPEAEKIALYLIEQGADISVGSKDHGQCAIHRATTPEVLDALLARGASINQIDDWGQTPLHDVDGVVHAKLLLDRGADPDGVAHAKLLLDRGADPNAADQDGNTPLHYAPDRATAALLLAHGADPSIQNHDNQIAEQYQGAEGIQDVVDYLRANRLRDALGKTASNNRPQDSDLVSPDDALARRSRGRCM